MSACWHVRPGPQRAYAQQKACRAAARERVRRQRRVAAGRASGSRALGSPPPPRLRRVCSSSVMAQRLPALCLVAICGSATASSEMMPAVSPRGWATQPRARASLCREAAAAAARSRGLRRRPAVALLVAARLGARHAGRVLYPSEHEASSGQCRLSRSLPRRPETQQLLIS